MSTYRGQELMGFSAAPRMSHVPPLFPEGQIEWNEPLLRRVYDEVADIAVNELGLDTYPNQIEIVSAAQMIEANCSSGMPIMYPYWPFGKRFIVEKQRYDKGLQGLAYEMVINSNPCISYNVDTNSIVLMMLVFGHAGLGHNHFFKNNYLFRQWTDPRGIIGYLRFARHYVEECERKYGVAAVEEILDAAHALMGQGVFRYRRRGKIDLAAESEQRELARREEEARTYREIWRTLPKGKKIVSKKEKRRQTSAKKRREEMNLPEENLLYFLEKRSTILEEWQRELLRIVRNIAQYLHVQRQTKMMNEGAAAVVHFYVMHRLYDKGLIAQGSLIEALVHHTNILTQLPYNHLGFVRTGFNPYALGFGIMVDMIRVATQPTAEDRLWFEHNDFVGCGDWKVLLRRAWSDYRDESFILQYLSPAMIRELHLFALRDDPSKPYLLIDAIHDERGYPEIRRRLAALHDVNVHDPDVQIVDADLRGDRVLHLVHYMQNGVPLVEEEMRETLKYVRRLWGYEVSLQGIDRVTNETAYEIDTESINSEESTNDEEVKEDELAEL